MKILFVCLGNICRSPAAEVCFQDILRQKKLTTETESCALGSWHAGKQAYPPMQEAAAKRGFDLSKHRARMITPQDYSNFDFLVAMDRDIADELISLRPDSSQASVVPYLGKTIDEMLDVPDPYYTNDYLGVMNLIIDGGEDILTRLLPPIKIR